MCNKIRKQLENHNKKLIATGVRKGAVKSGGGIIKARKKLALKGQAGERHKLDEEINKILGM